MALKKVSKATMNNDEDRFLQLMSEKTDIDQQIFALQQRREEVEKEMLEIRIKPFKIGQIVLAEIPSGRSRKWQKCLIECENGTLYLRPKKENGYSQRHFSITPIPPRTYADYLKEVKE